MKSNFKLFILLTAFLIGTCLYIPIDVYSDSSLDVSFHDNFPTGVTFSNDGTKMFIVGIGNDNVHEYALSTPFSVSTATLINSFNVGLQDTSPQDVTFSNDGTKMFIVGVVSDQVHEYALSTPFSIATSTLTISVSVNTQDPQPTDVTFSNDGSKMFIVGSINDHIYEYTLSTPFNITTPTFVNSLYVASQDDSPTGITFSNDGIKMFIVGEQNDHIYEYTLSTPFNITTPTLVNSLDIGSQDTSPQDVTFSNDGTIMFVMGNSNNRVYEYALSAPFDLVDTDSSTFAAQSDLPTRTTVTFNEPINGTLRFSEWSFDGNTPTAVSGHVDNSEISAVTELVFTHPITNILMPDVNYTGNELTDSNSNVMATAIVTASAPFQTTDFYIAEDRLPTGVKFSTNGTKMFVVASENATVYEYTLSIPFNVTTSTYANSLYLGLRDDSPTGITFSNDGAKMFIVGSTTDRVYEYALSTPFNVTTSTSSASHYVGLQDDSPTGVTFSNDGAKMFIVGEQNDSIYEYALSTPFNVATSTLVNSLNVSSQNANPSDIAFSTNGEKMFLVGTLTDLVYEYTLSTSFNVTTSTFVNSLYVGSKDNSPQGITFSTNGEKLFFIASQNATVYEHTLPASFDLVLHPPTFTAQSDSLTQTSVTFSEAINGTLVFSEWAFAGADTIAVSGYGDNSTLPVTIKLVFTHNITNDETPSVRYTGSSLAGSASNVIPFRTITADDRIAPTFTAQSDSSIQTIITFSEPINGLLIFSEWGFDGNVATRVSGYVDNSPLSTVTELVFTHDITNDQTPSVTYTGSSLMDGDSNMLDIATITADDRIAPTFTAQSDSSVQTTVTFSEPINGLLIFSEWIFDGNVATSTSGYVYNSLLSTVTELVFIHGAVSNQTFDVEYTGTGLLDNSSNLVSTTTSIASAPLQTTVLDIDQDELPTGITFSNDGTKMFITGTQKDRVYEYALSTPFNVTTSTFINSSYIGLQDNTPTGIAFSNDGSKMFIMGTENSRVYEYTLPVPFNVVTSALIDSLNVTSQDNTPTGIAFSNDGSKMFITGDQNNRVYEYALSTPFNVITSTLIDSLNVTSQDNTPTGIAFSNDGSKMFITGDQNSRVYEYALSTPFNITSSIFTGSLYTSLNNDYPQDMIFSNNGVKMFIVGSPNATLYEYALPASFDLVDTTQPVITGITSDATTFGMLKVGDTITFTLTTDSFEAGPTINGIYNSRPLDWSINNVDAYTATYTVTDGDPDQSTPLQLTNVIITDSNGITGSDADGSDVLKTIDANSPQFSSAETLSISQIAVTLDQSVTYLSASPGDFTLGGVDGASIGSIASIFNDVITLNVVGRTITNGDPVTISYTQTSGSFDDEYGNKLLDFTESVLNTIPVYCDVSNSEDWIITSDCTLMSNATVSGSIIVQNNTVLVIPDGTVLDIDFVSNNITIEFGSGLLIKSGGTLT